MMLTRISVSLFALISFFVAPIAHAGSGVVGYYNELQKIKHLGLDYPLEHRSGTWVTFNTSWNTAIRAVVDKGVKNWRKRADKPLWKTKELCH